MLVGQYFYSDAGVSGGVTAISRLKVVRPPPAAPYGLAPMVFAVSFRIC